MPDKLTMFSSYYEAAKLLPEERQGGFVMAIMSYAFEGEEPLFDDPMEQMAWTLIRPNIDKSIGLEQAGRKGGKSKAKNTTDSTTASTQESHPTSTLKSHLSSHQKSTSESTLDKPDAKLRNRNRSRNMDKDKERNRSGNNSACKATRFTPPSVGEVEFYAKENSLTLNAQGFVDYYAAQGWRLSNGNAMKDWEAAARNWARRDTPSKTNHGKEVMADATSAYGW
ncbi:DUF6291 domain-containing protein [Cryptobacterium curtum]